LGDVARATRIFTVFSLHLTNNANPTHLLFLMHVNGCIIMPFFTLKFSRQLLESNILQLFNSGAVNFFGKKGIQLLQQKMRQMKRYYYLFLRYFDIGFVVSQWV
jgi:hypothetical protein